MTTQTPPSVDQRTSLPKIKPGTRLKGTRAAEFSQQVVAAYATLSIRAICEETGRSYGAIYRILRRAEVTFRKRGYQHPVTPNEATESSS
ncbi:helix-turn-helix domain-containing protein [Streptomyces sp. NPDC001795]|uniref:helix-turn-helix domain-containing protein n=1 Tax=Streptomyces sp. NPDC001795 TaxID=3154525 RepID=UPI00331B4BCE